MDHFVMEIELVEVNNHQLVMSLVSSNGKSFHSHRINHALQLNASSGRIRKILSLEVPPHSRNTIIAHNPKLGQIFSNPREILYSIVRLDSCDQHAERIKNINT